MTTGCAEHRDKLRLLSIRRRLADEDLDPADRRCLEGEAAELEAELGLD